MDKRISIIIPVWNVDQYLRKCLDSVVAQTYQNLEIILIDDGSPDLCGEICDEYAERDSRFKVIHQKNAGVCQARNEGMKLVTGDYIGFVDPDDWCTPDMFEYLLQGAEDYEADIASCQYFRVTPGKETIARCDGETHVYTSDEAIAELVNRFIIRNIFWNKIFKREVFEGITFPVGRIYEGTAMLYLLIEKANKLVVLGEPKYYYFNNEKSYVNQETVKHCMDFVVTHINRYRELAPKYPQLQQRLMKDLIKGVLKLRYVASASCQSELDANIDDLQVMTDFLNEYAGYINTGVGLTKSQKKQLKHIKGLTVRDFKKAHIEGAISERKRFVAKALRVGPKVSKKVELKEEYKIEPELQQKLIRQMQLCELDILDQVVRICDAHKLTYYLYGGTLLGAVRHEGFIPWDDDVDIIMPRADYEEFGKICQEEFGKKYFYQTCFTDKGFPMLFAKVRREDSYVCEEKWEDRKMHKGIYIDILPLDAFPTNGFIGKMLLHMASLLHQACAFDECRSDKGFVHFMFKLLKHLKPMHLYKMRRRILKLSNFVGGKQRACSYGSHYQPVQKRVLKAEWFTGNETMEFEGRQLRIPAGWKGYLEYLFGKDYRQLPPPSARISHMNLVDTILPEEFQSPEVKAEDMPNYEEVCKQNQVIRQMQMVELDILTEVDRLCIKHGIKYFIYGGTLLGAVRHKGFIPWDDDMDIVMLRADYDRFAQICEQELDPHFYYQNCFKDEDFPMLFAKVRRNNSRVCEEKWNSKKMHKGIYIDILPLDDFTENEHKGNRVLQEAAFLHQVCAFKVCHSKNVFEKWRFRQLRKNEMVSNYELRDQVIRRENEKYTHTSLVCSYGSHYQPMRKRVLQKEWFTDSVSMEFEGRTFQAPIGWEAYLLHLFGKNYMQLPPVDERRCHVVLTDTVVPKSYRNIQADD